MLWILILVQEVEIHGLLSPDGRVEDEYRCSKKSIRCKCGCLGFQWRPYDSSSKAINISWRYCVFRTRSHNPPWTQLFKILNVIMAFCFTATSETLNCLLKLNQNFLLYPHALSFALLQAYLYLFILELTGCKLTITLRRVGEGCHHHCCHCFGLGLDYPIFYKTQVFWASKKMGF